MDPPDGRPQILTVSQAVSPSAVPITEQGTSNVIAAAAQDSTSPASVPQSIFKKRPLLNVVRGSDNSSVGTEGRKPVANVQNQVTTVATKTVKRFTEDVGYIGKHRNDSTGESGTK